MWVSLIQSIQYLNDLRLVSPKQEGILPANHLWDQSLPGMVLWMKMTPLGSGTIKWCGVAGESVSLGWDEGFESWEVQARPSGSLSLAAACRSWCRIAASLQHRLCLCLLSLCFPPHHSMWLWLHHIFTGSWINFFKQSFSSWFSLLEVTWLYQFMTKSTSWPLETL